MEGRCPAIYQVNDELHPCENAANHKGKHRANFDIRAGELPFTSHVSMTWTPWKEEK